MGRPRGKKKAAAKDDDEEIDEELAFTAEDKDLKEMFGEGEDEEDEEGDDSDEEEDGDETFTLQQMLEAQEKEGADAEDDDQDGSDVNSELEELIDEEEDGNVSARALRNIQRAATGRVISKSDRRKDELEATRDEDPDLVNPLGDKPSLKSLMSSLTASGHFGSLQKKLERVEGGEILAADVDKHKAKRIERDVAYDRTNELVSKWQSLVKKNRETGTLKFPMNAAPKDTPTTAKLATTFNPQTETEREIERILKESGLTDEKQARKDEDLQMNQLSKEEVEARRGELAKMKALMFLYEKKMKRIKKIKSKSFRRARKKEREKAAAEAEQHRGEDDKEYEQELAVTRERHRAEERMSLRHKNTSKWIKRQIQKGVGKYDDGTRMAIAEQIGIGQKLKRKQQRSDILGTGTAGSEEEDSGEDVDEERERQLLEKEAEELKGGLPSGKRSSLFSMKFMQRAMEKRKAEAEKLLVDVEDGETDGKDKEADQSTTGRFVFTGKKVQGDDEVNAEFQGENEADEGDDEEVKLKIRASEAKKTERMDKARAEHDNATLSLAAASDHRKAFRTDLDGRLNVDTEHAKHPSASPNASETKGTKRIKAKGHKVVEAESEDRKVGDEAGWGGDENPWLWKKSGEPEGEEAVPVVKDQPKAKRKQDEMVDSSDLVNEKKTETKKMARLEGQDLIRAAFAGAGTETEDFNRAKEAEIEAKLPKAEDVGAVVLPGWGNWGGKGSKTKKSQERFAKQAMEKLSKAKAAAISKRKDSAPELKHVVLSEKRLKRTTDLTVPVAPFPYKSPAQYESSLAVPLGKEWTAPSAFRAGIQPAVETRSGVMIDPIKFGGKKGKVRAEKRKSLAG